VSFPGDGAGSRPWPVSSSASRLIGLRPSRSSQARDGRGRCPRGPGARAARRAQRSRGGDRVLAGIWNEPVVPAGRIRSADDDVVLWLALRLALGGGFRALLGVAVGVGLETSTRSPSSRLLIATFVVGAATSCARRGSRSRSDRALLLVPNLVWEAGPAGRACMVPQPPRAGATRRGPAVHLNVVLLTLVAFPSRRRIVSLVAIARCARSADARRPVARTRARGTSTRAPGAALALAAGASRSIAGNTSPIQWIRRRVRRGRYSSCPAARAAGAAAGYPPGTGS